MNHWKQSTLTLIGLSVLALAGCSQSQGPAGSAPGPSEADKAAAAAAQRNAGAQAAAQQDAAAQRAGGQKAAAQAGATSAAGKTGQ